MRKALPKVLPVLFNTEMTCAILQGKKTVTRRVVKPQPRMVYFDGRLQSAEDEYVLVAEGDNGELIQIVPRYSVSDILYVREAFALNYFSKEIADFYNNGNRTAYRADFDSSKIGDVVPEPKWRPSIHMPKEAARIFLRVTDVGVERLQEITPEDVSDEGLWPYEWSEWFGSDVLTPGWKEEWAKCWDSTVKPADREKYGWDANPWVWCIHFDRCEKPEGWPV